MENQEAMRGKSSELVAEPSNLGGGKIDSQPQELAVRTMQQDEQPRKLADPVSADEICRYIVCGWAAILHETWPPRYRDDPTSDEFEAWQVAAYECGFVPHDVPGSNLVDWWRNVARQPDRFRRMSLQTIRKWNHVMWRGHRWGEGGFVDEALRLGAVQAMLRRLEAITAADTQ